MGPREDEEEEEEEELEEDEGSEEDEDDEGAELVSILYEHFLHISQTLVKCSKKTWHFFASFHHLTKCSRNVSAMFEKCSKNGFCFTLEATVSNLTVLNVSSVVG